LKTLQVARDLARHPKDRVSFCMKQVYVVSVDEQGPGHGWKEKIKELVDRESSKLGMSTEILIADRGQDLLESLKGFLQDHPEIIFDFVLVGRV
jgi:hypothetical protein